MIVMVQLNVQNVKINIIIQDHHAPNAYQIVMNVIQPHALTVPQDIFIQMGVALTVELKIAQSAEKQAIVQNVQTRMAQSKDNVNLVYKVVEHVMGIDLIAKNAQIIITYMKEDALNIPQTA